MRKAAEVYIIQHALNIVDVVDLHIDIGTCRGRGGSNETVL